MGYLNISPVIGGEEDRGRGERVNLAVTVFSLLMNDPPLPPFTTRVSSAHQNDFGPSIV